MASPRRPRDAGSLHRPRLFRSQREVDAGDVEPGTVHRVAMLSSETHSTPDTASTSERSHSDERNGPPVEEREVLDVETKDVGDQGDGIARVGPGYVIIVPETDLGERVSVEITEVRKNMAFACSALGAPTTTTDTVGQKCVNIDWMKRRKQVNRALLRDHRLRNVLSDSIGSATAATAQYELVLGRSTGSRGINDGGQNG